MILVFNSVNNKYVYIFTLNYLQNRMTTSFFAKLLVKNDTSNFAITHTLFRKNYD